MGPLLYDSGEEEVFLGRSAAMHGTAVSAETAAKIDVEVRRIIDECYRRAEGLMTEHRDKVERIAEALLKYETIDSRQIENIMQGREPGEPADWKNEPPGGGPKPDATRKATTKDSGSTIGGPAGQH
jgi:cell division protease FtsH